MIDIDFSRDEILIIRDSLKASSKSYERAIDSEIFDLNTVVAMVDRVSKIDSVLTKIDEWFGA